jgi:hypothetical protein
MLVSGEAEFEVGLAGQVGRQHVQANSNFMRGFLSLISCPSIYHQPQQRESF